MLLPAKRVALSGILASICVVCIFLASVLPSGKLSLYALSSFLAAIIVIEINIRYGWIFYIITVILAFILIPEKMAVIPYALFFGTYAMIKYYAELIKNRIYGYIIKIAFFNGCMITAYILYINILDMTIAVGIPLAAVIIILQPVFFIFDYIFTGVIGYYRDRLRKFLFR